jgi:hypothetical protein
MYLGNATESHLFPEICKKDGILNQQDPSVDNTGNREQIYAKTRIEIITDYESKSHLPNQF